MKIHKRKSKKNTKKGKKPAVIMRRKSKSLPLTNNSFLKLRVRPYAGMQRGKKP